MLALALFSCDGKSVDHTPPSEPGSTPIEATPESTGHTGLTEPPEPDQRLTLTLTDPAGAPLVDWTVNFCLATSCRTGTSDASGTVAYAAVSLAPYALHPVPPEGSPFATAFTRLSFETAGEERVVSLVVPLLEPQTALSEEPALIEVGRGLEVLVSSTSLVGGSFEPLPTAIAGVRVPESQWPPLDGLQGEVLGVWFVAPFDYAAPEGLPLRVNETLGLATGEWARVWVGSYSEIAWLDAGTLVSDGTVLNGEALLPLLSTVVITRD